MARKRKSKVITNTNKSLIDLIDRRHNNEKQETTSNNVVDTSLKEQYSNVFEKFNVTDPIIPNNDNNNNINNDNNNNDEIHSRKEKNTYPTTSINKDFDINHDNKISKKIDNKKRKKQISLAYLKSISKYPQLIDLTDTNSMYPIINTKIKSNKNQVQPPNNWKNKKSYLSFNKSSFISKKPFELPDIIKLTEIQNLRVNDITTNSSTLKETSRNKVQPKLNSLDLNFEKLYNIFFKIGKNWKPKNLLPYGDLFYENRNLIKDNSQNLINLNKKFKPGFLSDDLLKILNINKKNDNSFFLPPWCKNFKKFGTPPSYKTMKIPNINCNENELSNFDKNQYAYLDKEKEEINSSTNTNDKMLNLKNKKDYLFGRLLDLND